jgi:hypothetical protein
LGYEKIVATKKEYPFYILTSNYMNEVKKAPEKEMFNE